MSDRTADGHRSVASQELTQWLETLQLVVDHQVKQAGREGCRRVPLPRRLRQGGPARPRRWRRTPQESMSLPLPEETEGA